MSGALCGALAGEHAIPPSWLARLARLDREPKGPAYVRRLADDAFALWSSRRSARS